ncbi:hypothetical protein M430DRAFT_38457 [Amorphotheca resinae ATCC 22711]|uniref:Uncharacterized protein n=1 Tax=Amorphotheca resinae ATCC 22711 TaxID=857342 RepID=A0A2T3BEB1_AMORE|nr:hypothetical protein M430DRAFT_38457 [Amorphotheca resinae ATCC 22711]PSS27714.1 hypothetical protein M430DRAFT_38457 [Amorphotheca resinae ATCC 22711]
MIATNKEKASHKIYIESILADASGKQKGFSAQTNDYQQLVRELVAKDPSSDTAGDSQAIISDESGGRQERLEWERLEQERLAITEQERLEKEMLEWARLEQEKRDQERLEWAKLQESFAQKLREQEKIDQEEQEQENREQEQENRDLDKRRIERQGRERREQGRWEQEKTIESEGGLAAERTEPRPRRRQDPTPLAQTLDLVWIMFKGRERGVWRTAHRLHVYSSDSSEVERIAVKYIRKREQIRVYDTDLNILTPQICFQAAIANRSNMLLLIPAREIDINEELEASVSQMLSESDSQIETGIQ